MKSGFGLALVFALILVSGGAAVAGPTDVPRVLLAGDSWPAFMHLFRCLELAFTEYPGLSGFGERGHRTTLVGVHASEFDTPAFLDVVRDELERYPTIDIVHLSLGGNDFVYDSHWTPSMPPAQLQAFIDEVNQHIENVIDFILAVRPNIRVGLCGYDFVNHRMGGATPFQTNTVWAQYEQTKLEMAQGKPRVFYLHNLGLMQYHFGISLATPPVLPHQVPLPGGVAQNYIPFPGGDLNYNTPLEALMDDDLHLTMQGYDFLARRSIDECYKNWLSWPAVIEVLPLDKGDKTPVYTFRVTFSQPVTGVDPTDFAVNGSKAPHIVSVSGSGAVYTVTADLDGAPGPAYLSVVDDDSIVSTGLPPQPLGGPGAGNGGFDYNGPVAYADQPIEGPSDFDGALWSLANTFMPVAWMLGGQRFEPDYCDANGGSISVDPPQIVGNGMLDSAELGVIKACLDNPALDLSATGGVTHALVAEAWQHNYSRMQSDLGGPEGRVASVLPGLDSLLAGMMTLGDPGSTLLPVLLMTAIGAFIELPPGVSIPSPVNYTLLAGDFGPAGDADGDGFTNRVEYEYFVPLGGPEMYLMAALDPAMAPEPQCANAAGGTFNEGDPFCVSIPDPLDLGGGFEWIKDGMALSNDAVVSGSRWRELHFSRLRASDAGTYECIYDGGTKVFGPVEINLHPLPAATDAGRCVLAVILAAWGALALYRRARAGTAGPIA